MTEQDTAEREGGLTRRQVLATAGTGGTAGLAGCTGDPCQLTFDKSLDGQLHYGQQATYVFETCSTDDTFFDTAGTCDQTITITDDLPDGLSFVSVGGSTGGGSWMSTVSGGTVTLTNDTYGDIGDGTPSECLTVEMVVQIDTPDQFPGATPHQVENCADIGYDGQEYGTDCVSNTVTHDDCDLSVEKDIAEAFQYGQEGTYTHEVCNEGEETCTGTVTVEDDLPDGMSFVAASSGWTASVTGGVVTATNDGYGGLDPGECLSLELLVQVAPLGEFPGEGEVQNCAGLFHEGEEMSEDCVTHDITPAGECGLTVAKETDGEFVYGGEGTYVFEVCNEGEGLCTSTIEVEDDLPVGLAFDSVSGMGWTASTSGGVVTLTNDTYGSLAPGDCLTAEMDVSINPPNEAPGVVTNCADLFHDGEGVDQDCVEHPIAHPDCDLEFEKSVAEAFYYGQQGTYVFEICNPADEECTGPLTIEDDLPDGISFVDAPVGWVVDIAGGTVTLFNDSTGGVPAGGCLTVEMAVDVAPAEEFPGEGEVQNCATLSHDGDEVTESCLDHPVTADPCELSVEKDTGEFGDFEFSGLGTYRYEVCNVGDTECDGPITVVDDLPDGLSFGSVSPGWSASLSGGVLTATTDSYGTIAPGECVTLEVTVDVAPAEEFPGEGEVQNCATFSYSGRTVDEDCVSHEIGSPDPGECPAVEHVLDTGYDQATAETLPPGADDGDWEIVTDTTGSGPVPRPATVVEDGAAVFGTRLPGTRWIAHQQDAGIDGTQETIAYEYCFCLHEGFTDPVLSLRALADDIVADIQLNGTSLSFSGDGSVSTGDGVPIEESYTDPALFQAGENCLQVVVEDTQGVVSGLNIEGVARAENGDCDCVETCDLSVEKGTTGEFHYGEQFQAGYVYEVCNEGEQTCAGELGIVDPLPDGISGPVQPGPGLTGSVDGGVFEGTIQYSGLAPGECLARTVFVTVESAGAFPGDPPHEVENCAELLQDETVVDDDCTTHDVTAGDGGPCPPVEFDLNSGYDQDSGTTLGDGADDDDWNITADEAGTGPVPRPATVVNQADIPGNWPAPFADSRWIAHTADASYAPPPNSNYEFESCFCLREGFENPTLDLQIRADNAVVDILLNDTSLGFDGDGGFLGAPIEETYTDPDLFQAGENCLTIVLENEFGEAGLNVAGTMTAENADCDCDP